jgi:transglutaminase-like putative cysteine protease
MRISIDHVTRYAYEHPVRYSTQYLRLVPLSDARQQVVDWTLETPAGAIELRDGYGNILHVLTIEDPVTEIVIRSAGVVETSAKVDEMLDERRLSPLVFLRPGALTRVDGPLIDFAEQFRRRAATLTGLRALSDGVISRLPFQPGVTAVHSTAREAFEAGNGVCQDHAHRVLPLPRRAGALRERLSLYRG